MPQVQTIAGPVDADQLGRTLIHEHLCVRAESVLAQFPHLYDPEREHRQAVEAARSVMEHGVRTIADPAVMDLGRDVRLSSRVAEETGLQVVMSTGVYGQHYTFLPHHFQMHDVDYLADALVHDIEEGIQGTSIKAGFLKCAVDEPGINEDVEKVLRAVARAHRRTGVPAHRSWPTRTRPPGGGWRSWTSSARRGSIRHGCRSPTPATPTISTTSRSCSGGARTSAWTAMAWT